MRTTTESIVISYAAGTVVLDKQRLRLTMRKQKTEKCSETN